MRVAYVLLLSLISTVALAQSYQEEIRIWDEERVKELKAPNGWLNLAGLFWLKEGENSFGSGANNDLVFPIGKITERAGILVRKGDLVFLKDCIDPSIREGLLFSPDSANNPVMGSGDLRWNIIKRDDRIGVRLRDLKHPALSSFKGIERYTPDPAMRITARFEPHAVPTTVPITNMLGQTYKQFSPGLLHFSIGKDKYTFIALEEEGMLFIVFGDDTNGAGTYASGRFLKAVNPGKAAETILDFNKAYNPPCAFTPYATCPLPPRQNMLPLAIKAGEKSAH